MREVRMICQLLCDLVEGYSECMRLIKRWLSLKREEVLDSCGFAIY